MVAFENIVTLLSIIFLSLGIVDVMYISNSNKKNR